MLLLQKMLRRILCMPDISSFFFCMLSCSLVVLCVVNEYLVVRVFEYAQHKEIINEQIYCNDTTLRKRQLRYENNEK